MNVLITGASGFIGRKFIDAFSGHDVTGLCFSRTRDGLTSLDLRDPEAVHGLLGEVRPDLVVHCAARPTVDWCELHEDDARALNVAPSETLADGCREVGATLVFISTDYVFDGEAGPYHEEDPVHPINAYGRLKLEAEAGIRARLDEHLIIRTTNIYGYDRESKNFLMPLLPKLARGERVRVASDQYGNPTLVEDFCEAVRDLSLTGGRGVFHVVGPDWVNRVDWLRAAAEVFDLDPELVEGVITDTLDQPAPRPRKSGLYSLHLAAQRSQPLLGMRAGLESMRARWGGTVPVAEW